MLPDALLRRAAFGEGESAVGAWDAWARARDLSALDPTELRLLPAVYRNLRQAAVPDERIAPIVKQITRSLWIRTRLLLRQAAETVQRLEANGIESMLLKGAALVASGCCDAQARPMSDFDLLVHPNDARRAAVLLAEWGWIADAAVDADSVAFRHAVLMKKGETSCDLHWWALWDSRDEEGDARFRRGAESAMLDGVPVRVPRPEHQLLHVIVHGTRAFDETSVRWIGDALAVLRGRELDWPLFVDDVRSRGVSYPVGEALAYLVESFGAAVPADAITTLRAARVPRNLRRLYVPHPDAPRGHASFAFMRSLVDMSRRQRHGPLWLARNLQYVLGVPNLLHLPLALLKRTGRLLMRVSRRS